MMIGSVSRRFCSIRKGPLTLEYLDRLIAQKARRYVEVASQGLRFFPAAAETLRTTGGSTGRWQFARGRCELRSSTL